MICSLITKSFGKAKLVQMALAGLMFLGAAGVASADCGRAIEHKRLDLDRAIARHGYYSRQADHERRELARVRAECRYDRGFYR